MIKICEICKKKFAGEKKQKLCSNKCSGKYRTKKGTIIKICKTCKRKFKSIVSKNRKYCSFKCRICKGSNNSQWKGGKWKSSNGYIYIYKPKHPFAIKRHTYVKEHRLVMEQILGRYLKPFESVHHINGIKDDNRPKNLRLIVLSKNWHPKTCPNCNFHFLIK